MFSVLLDIVACVVTLGILITVHECGHFLVARLCGVRIERFCIGFGRVLWCHTDRLGTEYAIALIPLGGYVKMLDERIEKVVPALRDQAFNNQPIWQRAAIVSAGPMTNFLFAILAYWLIFILGIPTIRPVISTILPQSIADKAEISAGMEFKSVDGVVTPDWESVRLALISRIGAEHININVALLGSSQPVSKVLDVRQWNFKPDQQDPITTLGIIPKGPKIESVLSAVQPDSAAQKAGLHVGDKILMINDHPLDCWQTLVQLIQDNPGRPLTLEVKRNGSPIFLTLIPNLKEIRKGEFVGFAGVIPTILSAPEEYQIIQKYNWLPALYQAREKIWQLTRLTVGSLAKLITGDMTLNNLSGPISIAQGAGAAAGNGLVCYLMFLALISINLGTINLLPLPMLDGGHLFFLTLEKLKGKPISEKVQDYSYRLGAIMLVLLMGLALFNDFYRLL
ncbi:sigma E protease regulator RseP [Candidatus Gillettellia adelgis]